MVTAAKDTSVIIWYYNNKEKKYFQYSQIQLLASSALFNNNSNYVIVASDSSFDIYNLMGEYHDFYSDDNKNYTYHEFTPVCRAEFTKSSIGVLITRYSDKPITELDQFPWRMSLLTMLPRVDNNVSYKRPYKWYTASLSYGFFTQYELDTLITGFDFSPDVIYQAYYSYIDSATTLVTTIDKYFMNIARFSGHHPEFSPDGNYLITIRKNRINMFPANDKEIRKLVFEKKIFGEIIPEIFYMN
jgi:WD40 repeat protein